MNSAFEIAATEWVDTERGPTCACGMPTYVSLVDVGREKLPVLVCFAHGGTGASFPLARLRPPEWPNVTGAEVIALVDRGFEEHRAALAAASVTQEK